MWVNLYLIPFAFLFVCTLQPIAKTVPLCWRSLFAVQPLGPAATTQHHAALKCLATRTRFATKENFNDALLGLSYKIHQHFWLQWDKMWKGLRHTIVFEKPFMLSTQLKQIIDLKQDHLLIYQFTGVFLKTNLLHYFFLSYFRLNVTVHFRLNFLRFLKVRSTQKVTESEKKFHSFYSEITEIIFATNSVVKLVLVDCKRPLQKLSRINCWFT